MTAGLRARPAPARTPGPQGGWRVVLQLTLVESRRLLRHPLTLLAAGYSVYLLWRASQRFLPVLHTADADATVSLLPLAAATLLVTNLAASRAHRHHSQEIYAATATAPWHRTCAHLLSGGAVALLALAMAVADMLWLGVQEGAVGMPSSLELLTGPAIVWGAGALGVLAAVWAPSPVTGPLLLVVLTAAHVNWLLWFGASPRFGLVAFSDRPVPAGLMSRPAGWHLLYVLGLGVLLAGLALARRGPRVPVAALLAVGLAAATGGGVAPSRPVPADLQARRSALAAPETVQTCQRDGEVTVCAFAGFERWIPLWEDVAADVVDQLPPAAAAPRPVTVRQFLPWWSWGVHAELGPAPQDRWPVRPPREGEVVVSTVWGRPGDRLGLASDVAVHVLGLQATDFPPSDEVNPPVTGVTHYCQAPAIVALWLSAQADPDAPAVMRRALETEFAAAYDLRLPIPVVTFTGRWTLADRPAWGRREVQYALQLLDRPDDEVRAVIERDWSTLTTPDTTRAEAVERFGLDPLPPFREELLDRGVPTERIEEVTAGIGLPLDATDADATC